MVADNLPLPDFPLDLEKSDVYNMALTCHTFYNPAMDRFWSSLPGLGPLVRLLPEKYWYRIGGGLKIKELPDPQDPTTWLTFDAHARRVRRIAISDAIVTPCGRWIDIDGECLGRLAAVFDLRGKRILPGLRILIWPCDSVAVLTLENVKAFLQPTLRGVEFYRFIYDDMIVTKQDKMFPVLKILEGPEYHLTSFTHVQEQGTFNDDGFGPHLTPALWRTVCKMDSSRLTRLEIGDAWIDAAALDHIGTLPFLQYLQFSLGSDFLEYLQICKGPFRAAQSGTPIFSALTSLVLMMRIADADPLMGFLEIISPAKLLEFTFIFAEQPGEMIAHWCQPSATNLSKLFSALLKFESLQYLKCTPRASLDFLQDQFEYSRLRISWSTTKSSAHC